jgi:methionine synthase II (cobalamin-independent)
MARLKTSDCREFIRAVVSKAEEMKVPVSVAVVSGEGHLNGKILIPGVVSHVSNTIEHPELISDRIRQFAGIVGRENVIAGTDCGMGGRIHMQLGWAKLKALAEGAERASKILWAR